MARQRDFKAEYAKRVAAGLAKGYSKAQASGHARKAEKPVSAIKAETAPKRPPKITTRGVHTVGDTKLKITNSTRVALANLKRQSSDSRFYLQLWDNKQGKYTTLYRGMSRGKGKYKRTVSHGMTVSHFLERFNDLVDQGMSDYEAFSDIISSDSDMGDSDPEQGVPEAITQVSVYVIQ